MGKDNDKIIIYAEPISLISTLIIFAIIIYLLNSKIHTVLNLTTTIIIIVLIALSLIFYAFSISHGMKIQAGLKGRGGKQ